MSSMKTELTFSKSLWVQIEMLAREMKISPKRLLLLALEDFINRHQNQILLERINAAYADEPDSQSDETLNLRHMRRQHRRLVEGEW